ncbi:MAG: hypothetical protein RIR70_163 [Pseudomonadota bacterium]|jgi:iron complex transport system ATP-binding protein
MSVLLEASGLSLMRAGRVLLRELDFSLQAGSRLAILGKNGAGKSTLLHALAGLYPPHQGSVRLAGRRYSQWSPRQAAVWRGIVLQQHAEPFGASVLESALIGRHPHLSRFAIERAEDEALAVKALAAVGLGSLTQRRADQLSGGERQRLAIATLLVQAPKLMLLDEPLTHLDLGSQVPILECLSEAAQEGALVMALHEPTLALRFCTHALVIFDEGHWEYGLAEEVITGDTLSRLHGHHFHALFDGQRRVFVPA